MSEQLFETLAAALQPEELAVFLAGKDSWTTVAIPRLGIPAIKVSDGPNGARGGGSFIGGVTAAAFPVGIALGATFNVELAAEIGAALSQEARSKGARVLLAPTVNLHRSPLNGRNFECYSEDPFLTSELAVAYIAALQANGVAATIKHFIGNESEYQRHTISSDIDERALRELYLPPFEAAVKRARTWALMTSYNRLNGTYVSERADLVRRVLKEEWGFDGLVMSDWFGTQSTEAAVFGGLDLEMPGPPRFRGDKLLEAIRAGRVDDADLRDAALRLLRLIDRVGAFDDPAIAPERAEDRPETRALIRRAGAEAATLLKNDGALPLRVKPGMRIAVIGPNAKTAEIMGGGSAQLNPHYRISPWDGLRAALPDDVRLDYESGAGNRRLTSLVGGDVEVDYFHGRALAGSPCHQARLAESQFMFFGVDTPGFDPRDFSARMRFTFRPDASGPHEIGLIASGPARIWVDNEMAIDASDFQLGQEVFGCASDEVRVARAFEAGRDYRVVVEYRAPETAAKLSVSTARVGVERVLGEAELARAAEIAARADVALLFVGLNGEWDGEGMDRANMDLPGPVDTLIQRVADVAKKTIVVLQTGGPVAMPWLDKVDAVLQAWYPGQELGNAVADVLLGKAEPGGRLPQSFPRRLEDNPAYLNYPGDNGHVRYGEGVYIGYRYYEKKKIEPLFPFGFGLSYASFACSDLRLSAQALAPGAKVTAQIEVSNTSTRDGSTVLQFYVADERASVSRPEKELKGFTKLKLGAGETRTAQVELDMRAFAWFDVARRAWVAEAGRFTVLAGLSSREIVGRAELVLESDWIEACEAPRA